MRSFVKGVSSGVLLAVSAGLFWSVWQPPEVFNAVNVPLYVAMAAGFLTSFLADLAMLWRNYALADPGDLTYGAQQLRVYLRVRMRYDEE